MGPSRLDASNVPPRIPVPLRPHDLIRHKRNGQAITMLTAWDSLSGALVEQAGADAVLVGDSLAMVALGHATTLPVTLEQMRHHTLAVSRGFGKSAAEQPLIICDLPFLRYHVCFACLHDGGCIGNLHQFRQLEAHHDIPQQYIGFLSNCVSDSRWDLRQIE